MRVQEIDPGQYEALGEVTVRAYRAIPGRAPSPEYERVLRDVAGRAKVDRVLVAVDDDGALLGGVTYVSGDDSPYAEFEGADRAAFRMLAVDPAAQGAGAGRALIEACIGVARAEGKRWLTLMTTEHMEAARRLYERLGFRRAPKFDMMVEEGRLQLVSYVLELN
jgi:ribosomal protein S18 acetylase RimI-like enzyme